jgi:hypothetical protein
MKIIEKIYTIEAIRCKPGNRDEFAAFFFGVRQGALYQEFTLGDYAVNIDGRIIKVSHEEFIKKYIVVEE